MYNFQFSKNHKKRIKEIVILILSRENKELRFFPERTWKRKGEKKKEKKKERGGAVSARSSFWSSESIHRRGFRFRQSCCCCACSGSPSARRRLRSPTRSTFDRRRRVTWVKPFASSSMLSSATPRCGYSLARLLFIRLPRSSPRSSSQTIDCCTDSFVCVLGRAGDS